MIFKIIKIFLQAPCKSKIEIIKYFYTRLKERFIDYWLGTVSVIGQDIHCENNQKEWEKKLYTFSIIAGQYGRGVWFSEIPASKISQIIEQLKEAQGKRFQLHIDYGCGVFNEYTFNKRLTKLLLEQLEELSKQEIYYEESEEEE